MNFKLIFIKLLILKVGRATGVLNNFIIEPFIQHNQQDEYYICIYSHREGETILFHHEGGVDVGDIDAKALKLTVLIDEKLNTTDVITKLLINVANQKRKEYVIEIVVLKFIF